MRTSRLLTAITVAAAVLVAPQPAAADIFVSPFLGVKFRGSTTALDFDLNDGANDTKLAVGLSGVLITDRGIGLELEVAHQPRFFEGADADDLNTRSGVTTLGGNLMLALPISITRESLRPYAVVGLGWMHATSNDLIRLDPSRNDFLGLTLGVGAVGFVSDVVGLRFDLRHLKSVSEVEGANPVNFDRVKLSFWRATVGVVFR